MDKEIDLGKVAYDAYAAEIGWLNRKGELIPKFDQLSPEERIAWGNAFIAVEKKLKESC